MRAERLPHYLDIESPDPYVMQNRYITDDDSEMLLLSNSNRFHEHQTRITFSQDLTRNRQAQIWDLHTGERYALPLAEDGSYTFDLGPVESVLVVFEKTKTNDLQPWQPLHYLRANMTASDLSKDWDVALCHSLLHDTTNAHFDTLFDLQYSEAYQHFCGTIVYRKSIDCHSTHSAHTVSTLLDLGMVEGVSEVFVNGQSSGVQYFGRRIYDLTDLLQEGCNNLEVHVTTTMGNYLKSLSQEENPAAWFYMHPKKVEQPFHPQGMLGPVKIYQ